MNGVNKAILMGTLGKDPETRIINESSQVSKFSLATNNSYKNKNGEKVEETQWHNVEVWNGLSKVVSSYVKKGSTVYLEGTIKYSSYENKEGQKVYKTTIHADVLNMISTGGNHSNGNGNGQNSASSPTASSASSNSSTPSTPVTSDQFVNSGVDDDLPF